MYSAFVFDPSTGEQVGSDPLKKGLYAAPSIQATRQTSEFSFGGKKQTP